VRGTSEVTAPTPEGGPIASGEQEHLTAIAAFFDRFAPSEGMWRRRNRAYYELLESLHRFVIPSGSSILEIGSGRGDLLAALGPSRAVGVDVSSEMVELARSRHPDAEFVVTSGERFVREEKFDYVLLSDLVPFAFDLQAVLHNLRAMTHDGSRVIVHSYSQLWRPIIRLAELVRLKPKKPIQNWVAVGDMRNLLELAGFEVVSTSRRILFPKRIPFLSTFLNGFVGSIWPLSYLSLTWWLVARPVPSRLCEEATVSIVVPCRNESGMIREIIERTPELGAATEIVFVEGGSTDGTREVIEQEINAHPDRDISLHVQTGVGKGDAVRLGFEHAKNELLMILDADLTVQPEELPKFYAAVVDGHADLANGSRLVYNLQANAMQFLNVLGNQFFSAVFSVLLRQHVKDTLCGTKVLRRRDYEAIARSRRYFGDFDPFGDFDLLLGGGRLGLKIVDIPIRYRARTYGTTNISRFRHGWLLLKMAAFAFWKFRVAPYRRVRS
jgi:SAM-dependent methyltransferase